MADTFDDQVAIDDQAPSNPADVEMTEGAGDNNADSGANPGADDNNNNNDNEGGGDGDGENTQLPFAEGGENDPDTRTTFISYLASPVVTLLVGDSGAETILSAHQALLTQSPWFADVCAAFSDDAPRQIELVGENLDAVGCFLEYLYTGDYFPKKLPGQRALEPDPSVPSVDESGEQLLEHARVYTLAEKFGVDKLRTLASSKIHCVNSTAKGEITYARYVYQYTSKADTTVRAPVANFWATRSHTLRAEAETEFRSLCLEFPEFGYDVLTRVLDEKLKREKNEKMHPASSSGRKRARHSNV